MHRPADLEEVSFVLNNASATQPIELCPTGIAISAMVPSDFSSALNHLSDEERIARCLATDPRHQRNLASDRASSSSDYALIAHNQGALSAGSSLPSIWSGANFHCEAVGQLIPSRDRASWDAAILSQGDSQTTGGLVLAHAMGLQTAAARGMPDTRGLLPPPYLSTGPLRSHRRRHRRRRSRRRQRSRHRIQSVAAAGQVSLPISSNEDEHVYSHCSRVGCRARLASCLQFRRVLILLATLGVACVVAGIALGALHSPSNSFLTLALMFIGLGLMLVIVVVIGWRCTPPEHEPCHVLFGLGAYCTVTRSRVDRRRRERHYWIGGLLYPEFRFRRPPPSYATAMLDNSSASHNRCAAVATVGLVNGSLVWDLPNVPPPTYKSHDGVPEQPVAVAAIHNAPVIAGSLPPTYRSNSSGPRLALDEVWVEAAALWAASHSETSIFHTASALTGAAITGCLSIPLSAGTFASEDSAPGSAIDNTPVSDTSFSAVIDVEVGVLPVSRHCVSHDDEAEALASLDNVLSSTSVACAPSSPTSLQTIAVTRCRPGTPTSEVTPM